MNHDPSPLPAVRLRATDRISRRFCELDVTDLHEAIRYVRDLPYGRPSEPTDVLTVLEERIGTCSTKHALLARLCLALDVSEVRLTLGIYEMNETNTPGVGPVLDAHGLEYLPEAHCYLVYEGTRFDFTGGVEAGEPIDGFLHEETIRPEQIGDYKTECHRAFLSDWAETTGVDFDPDELWEIRESCIERLAAQTAP